MPAEITCSAPTGLVLTARLAQGATIGASITMTESGTLPGYYTGSVPGGTAAGRYAVMVLNGTVPIGAGELRWDGAAEIVPSVPGDAMALTAGERTATRGVIEASTVLALQSTSTAIKAKTDNLPAAPAAVGSAMTLTTGERSALAAVIEAALLADGDGQAFVNAIVAAIGNVNVDQAVLIAAIRADIERAGGMLSTRATLAAIEASTVLALQSTSLAIKAKTDALPAAPAAVSDIPAAATVAAAVRTNLATELARVDVAISTREAESAAATRSTTNVTEHDATQAAIAALTVPPSTAAITAAVRADIERANGMLDLVATKAETEAAITAIGDPLTRAVPGTYPAGSAGEALGKLVVGPPDEPAVVVPGAPAEAGLCRVYAYLEGIDNDKRLRNVKVLFRLVGADGQAVASERLIGLRETTVTVDGQGRLQGPDGNPWVDLQRNDELEPAGTAYEVTSVALGIDRKEITLAAEVADLRALLLAA